MDKTTQEIVDFVRSLDLPTEDYAIFGSCPMAAHGLKEHCHDIDIIARNAAWERTKKLGEVQVAPMGDKVVRLRQGTVEIFDGWAPGPWDTDELIDTADTIDGLPYVNLPNVLAWKKRMMRRKDVHDIKTLEAHLTPGHE